MPQKNQAFAFSLPEGLHNHNGLVEVVAFGQTKLHAYFSNSLSVQVLDNYGQVRVTPSLNTNELDFVDKFSLLAHTCY